MANLYFDILPYDIQKEIYGIRLSNALARTYYRKVAQKVALAYLVLRLQKLNFGEFWNTNALPRASRRTLAYNPECPHVRYVIEKSCKIINSSDDRIWWISQLIRPIEAGLNLLTYIYGLGTHPIGEFLGDNCLRTEYACDRLIEILGCNRNPNRSWASLS